MAKKDGTNFYHHDHMDVGENLAWNSREPVDCRIPLQLWYDEWKTYNFQNPHINPRNGHFSQLVWKSSQRIGCGQAISKGRKGGTFTVCNYDPPGNYKGEEVQNVSPPLNGVGVQWNPLGSNSNVQLPPLSSSGINYSARKINNWLAKPTTTFGNNKYHYPKRSFVKNPYMNYGYGVKPAFYW